MCRTSCNSLSSSEDELQVMCSSLEVLLLLRSSGTLLNLHELYARDGCHGNEDMTHIYTHEFETLHDIYYTSILKYAYTIVLNVSVVV